MAFDAGFTKAIINELSASVTNARVEKIFQPSKESVLFVLRGERNGADRGATMKLLIDAGSANPRMSLADPVFDNPKGSADVLYAPAEAPRRGKDNLGAPDWL